MSIPEASDKAQEQPVEDIIKAIDLTAPQSNMAEDDLENEHLLAIPYMNMIKLVSVDNGSSWQETDAPIDQILSLGSIPLMGFVVANNSIIPLTDMVGAESVLDFLQAVTGMIEEGNEELPPQEQP